MIQETYYMNLDASICTGAGVAALTGMILKPKVNNLEVVAFASPPILDYKSSLECRSFVTTVVNNTDIIPRASLANLGVLKAFLVESVRPRLAMRGILPADFSSMATLIQFLTNSAEADESDESKWIMTAEEAVDSLQSAFSKVPLEDEAHLYVPGRVLYMYSLFKKKGDGRKAHRVKILEPQSEYLRDLEMELTMVSDHLSPSYRSSIRDLLDL